MIADRPVLSLAELELHDPRPTGHGAERRFLCPFPACAHDQRREHKNLAANIETGLWACKRCGASGRFTEKWERLQPRPRLMRLGPYEKARRALGLASAPASGSPNGHDGSVLQRSVPASTSTRAPVAEDDRVAVSAREGAPAWRRRWDQAVPVVGTPGEAYLAGRGIPVAIATAAGVRYLERWEHWTRNEHGDWQLEGSSRRVVFPIVDKAGELIGIQGRKIADGEYGEKMLTNGRGGIFVAGTAWPVDQVERVAIVEAPIDALSLAAVGVPAVATQGTSWPDWLPLALAFKKVLLAHDNDEPNVDGERAGDTAAASLVPALRSYGAEPERYPPLSKDWNQDLQDLGLEQLRHLVAGSSAIEAVAEPAEIATEHCPPATDMGVKLAPELPVESTADAPPGAEPVEEAEREQVVELLGWLHTANLPHERFQLRPWQNVVDVARFAATLQAELSSEAIGPRWRAAAEDLRQLARTYRAIDDGRHQGSARLGRAPPLTCLHAADVEAEPACLPF